MPGSTEEMWLDWMSMIKVINFMKPADRCRIQCNDMNGESFQVHTEVGVMRFKRNKEGPCHHQFSPEFIKSVNEQEMQLPGTTEEMPLGTPTSNKREPRKHENHIASLVHQQQRISSVSLRVTRLEIVQ